MMRNEELQTKVKSTVLLIAMTVLAAALSVSVLSGCAAKTSTEDDTAAGTSTQSSDQAADANADSEESSNQNASGEDQPQENTVANSQTANEEGQANAGEDPADEVLDAYSDKYPVTFTVQAPGYSSTDGKIPVSVAGTSSDGKFIDATAYVGADGTGLSVPAGTYTVMVIESPLVANGVFYTAPDTSWEIDVSQDSAQGGAYVVDTPMTFTKADLSNISSDIIETAYEYAISGGLDRTTADTYKAALLG